MSERTTVRLPTDLLNRAKRKAAAEGRTLTSLIEDGLRLVTADNRANAKAKRVLPRVSRATGGPMPGVDDTDLSSLQGDGRPRLRRADDAPQRILPARADGLTAADACHRRIKCNSEAYSLFSWCRASSPVEPAHQPARHGGEGGEEVEAAVTTSA